MNVIVGQRISLSIDELLAAAAWLGIDELPTVLAVRPRYDNAGTFTAAFELASRTLTARGLLAEATVDPDLVAGLAVLDRPDRELAMRVVTPIPAPGGTDGVTRISVVRRGRVCAVAQRTGDQVALGEIGHDARAATQAVLAELPAMAAARIEPVGAPLGAMTECVDAGGDGIDLADRVRALGVEARAALLFGSALGSRLGFAEITYSARDRDAGRLTRCAAAVAVFYTRRGRIVSAPSISPSGERWVTLKPGSDHAIAQAIGQLIEISTERWEDAATVE